MLLPVMNTTSNKESELELISGLRSGKITINATGEDEDSESAQKPEVRHQPMPKHQ